MIFLGIDPGKSGGIVALQDDGSVLFAVKMPDTDEGVWSAIKKAAHAEKQSGLRRPIVAVIERVWSSPQMGVTSAFTFGRGYGALCMALTAHCVPFSEVIPQNWQKAMNCRTGGDKSITKSLAQQMFPALKVTNALADALVIASYCRLVHAPSKE